MSATNSKTRFSIFLLLLSVSLTGLPQDTQFRNYQLKSEGRFIVKAVLVDSIGLKWFGTNRGLLRYDGESWKYFTAADHLISNQVNTLTFEQSSYGPEIWVGTNSGVSVLAYHPVDGVTASTSYSGANGVMGDSITGVAVDSWHNKFFGSESGITWFHSGIMDSITYEDYQQSLLNAPVNSFKMHNDSLYVAYDGGIGRLIAGVDAVTGASRWTSEYGITPYAENIRSIEVDPRGDQWFGTDVGVQKHVGLFAKDNWFLYDADSGLVQHDVLSVTSDGKGGMWFGTHGGVSHFDGDNWTSYTVADGLLSDTVYDIAVDTNGSVWFATHRGVSRLTDTSFSYQYTSVMERQFPSLGFKSYYNAWEDAIQLSYSLPHPERISVSLYSMDGVLFRQWQHIYSLDGHNQVKLRLESAPGNDLISGIYLVRVAGRSLQDSRKIVIIRR
jgi:ligand-binding sensor domain-containing protein